MSDLQQFVREKLGAARTERVAREANMNVNMSYYLGDQWVQFSTASRSITKLYSMKPQLITVNVITPTIDTVIGQITGANQRLVSTPLSGETQDIEAAGLSTSLLNTELWHGCDMRMNVARMLPIMATCEWVYLYCYFNPSKGKKYSKEELNAFIKSTGLDQAGHPLYSKDVHEGKVEVSILTPFEVTVDPNATSLENAQWFIISKIRSKNYVHDTWGKDVEVTDKANTGVSATFRTFMANLGQGPIKDHDSVLVHELWRRPCESSVNPDGSKGPGYPKGQYFVCTETEDLCEDTLPWGLDIEGLFPLVKADWKSIAGKFGGTSPFNESRTMQREINMTWTQLIAYKNAYMFPAILNPSDNGVTKETMTNKPREFVTYTPSAAVERGGQPSYLQAPQTNWQFFEEQQELQKQIENLWGVSGVMGGQIVSDSGNAQAQASSAGESRINGTQMNVEEALSKLGHIFLVIVENTYDIERTIASIGQTNATSLNNFKGEMLKGNTHCICELKSGLPMNKMSLINVMNTFFTNGIIPRTPAGLKSVHKVLQLDSLFALDTDLSTEQAKWENSELDKGDLIFQSGEVDPQSGQPISSGLPRNPWDDDAAHLDEHTNRQRKVEFLALIKTNPAIAECYELHMLEHHKALAQKMQVPDPGMEGQPGPGQDPNMQGGQGGPGGPQPQDLMSQMQQQ